MIIVLLFKILLIFIFNVLHFDLKNFFINNNYRYGNNLHWYVPSGSKSWFEKIGISYKNIIDMTWWSEAKHIFDKNCAKIIYTPANHHSRRTLFDYQKALWGSWVVIGANGSKFWFGGDTAYSDVFQQIGKRYGPFDLSAIPIGMLIDYDFFYTSFVIILYFTNSQELIVQENQ